MNDILNITLTGNDVNVLAGVVYTLGLIVIFTLRKVK